MSISIASDTTHLLLVKFNNQYGGLHERRGDMIQNQRVSILSIYYFSISSNI
jgi:hypothetical protein